MGAAFRHIRDRCRALPSRCLSEEGGEFPDGKARVNGAPGSSRRNPAAAGDLLRQPEVSLPGPRPACASPGAHGPVPAIISFLNYILQDVFSRAAVLIVPDFYCIIIQLKQMRGSYGQYEFPGRRYGRR